MFEFHGWAVLRDDETTGAARVHDRFVASVKARVEQLRYQVVQLHISEVGNDMTVLAAHGLRNHLYKEVLALFEWIAEVSSNSYGLLYVHDDEYVDQDNEFRVWRLARGRLEQQSDPFLSPCIPTIEDAHTDG